MSLGTHQLQQRHVELHPYVHTNTNTHDDQWKIVLNYLSSTEQHKAGQVSLQFPPSIALPPFTC